MRGGNLNVRPRASNAIIAGAGGATPRRQRLATEIASDGGTLDPRRVRRHLADAVGHAFAGVHHLALVTPVPDGQPATVRHDRSIPLDEGLGDAFDTLRETGRRSHVRAAAERRLCEPIAILTIIQHWCCADRSPVARE
jgi:hypothetical protein